MTRNDAAAAAEVMQHYANGGELQVRCRGQLKWDDYRDKEPHFNWKCYEYRIKPELLECWANEYPGTTTYHATEARAKAFVTCHPNGPSKWSSTTPTRVAVHLREVEG